jgi:hypothetical protein
MSTTATSGAVSVQRPSGSAVAAITATTFLVFVYYFGWLEEVVFRDGPGTIALLGVPVTLATAMSLLPVLLRCALILAAGSFALTLLLVLRSISARQLLPSSVLRVLPHLSLLVILAPQCFGLLLPRPLLSALIWLTPALAFAAVALELHASSRRTGTASTARSVSSTRA